MFKFSYEDETCKIEHSDIAYDDLFDEFKIFVQSVGYILPENNTVLNESFVKPSYTPITRWTPDCLKSVHWNCPSRTDTGKCLSDNPCEWKQGYDPND